MLKSDPTLISSLRDRLLASEGKDGITLECGTIVGEEYLVKEKINNGGTGVIYKCHKRSEPDKLYALKVTIPKSANAARRFQAEVMASYQVKHPNVLRSIDCLFHGNALTYIMEYAPGGDLRTLLDLNQQIPIPTFLILAKQLAAGLAAIHDKKIVHRDIKPENILFSSNGQIKIADFGISFTSDVNRVTSNGSLVGTINYMAPEYVRTGIFDARSDIFSLGVLLYELLTKKHPYGYSRSLEELIEKMDREIDPIYKMRNDCPVALEEIVYKTLEKNQDERYQSAAELLMDLTTLEQQTLLKEKENLTQDLLKLSTRKRKRILSGTIINFMLFIVGTCLTTIILILLFKHTQIL